MQTCNTQDCNKITKCKASTSHQSELQTWTVCLHSFLAFFQIFSKHLWWWVFVCPGQILCQKKNLIQTIFCWNQQVRVLSPQSTSSCCRYALLTSSLAAKICNGDLKESIMCAHRSLTAQLQWGWSDQGINLSTNKPASKALPEYLQALPQNTQCIIYQTDCIQRLMYSKLFTVVPLQLMFQVTKQSLSKLLNRHDSIWWLLFESWEIWCSTISGVSIFGRVNISRSEGRNLKFFKSLQLYTS
jgi:hypothetical protein